jgi:hypothetical protein
MAVDVLEALVSLDYDFMGVAPLIGDDAHESVVDRRSAAPPRRRLYYGTEEAADGKNAFLEKRKPDFAKYRN